MGWDLQGTILANAAAIESRKGQGMARHSRQGYGPIASRAIDSLVSFKQWLGDGRWGPLNGWLGETGIPNGATPIGSGIGPYTPVAVDQYMATMEAVQSWCDDNNMGVLYFDCNECQVEQLAMYGPDTASTGNKSGPLSYKYPSSVVYEGHLTNAGNQYGPYHGICLKNSYEGGGYQDVNNAPFSNTRETRTFNIGAGLPLGTEYNYGRPDTWQFFKDNKTVFVRIPLRWERFQRSITSAADGGPLDPVEVARLDDSLTQALAMGCKVILDLHNGLSYYQDNGSMGIRRSLGNGVITQAMLVGFWTRLASHYATALGVADPNNQDADPLNPGNTYMQTGRGDLRNAILGYEIMNEPKIYSTDGSTSAGKGTGLATAPGRTAGTAANRWAEAANAAGQAIRALDANAFLFVHPYGGGGSGPTFWQYHGDGPFMYASGPVAGGSGNTNFQTRVYYIGHMYYNFGLSGDYTVESYRSNYKSQEGNGWLPQRKQRVGLGVHVSDGEMLTRKWLITGQGTRPDGSNMPSIAAAGTFDVLTPTDVPYAGAPGHTMIISDMYATGTSGQTIQVYVRPPGNAANSTALGWLRTILTIGANGTTQMHGPTFVGPGSTLVVVTSGTGMGLIMNAYDTVDSELVVATLGNIPATVDAAGNTLYTCPAGCMARVLNHGSGSPPGNGWAGYNTTGSGITGAAASATINVQGRIKPSGGAAVSVGIALPNNGNSASLGPSNIFPGVPSHIIDCGLQAGDSLILNPSAAGMNVWALLEVQGL